MSLHQPFCFVCLYHALFNLKGVNNAQLLRHSAPIRLLETTVTEWVYTKNKSLPNWRLQYLAAKSSRPTAGCCNARTKQWYVPSYGYLSCQRLKTPTPNIKFFYIIIIVWNYHSFWLKQSVKLYYQNERRPKLTGLFFEDVKNIIETKQPFHSDDLALKKIILLNIAKSCVKP